MSKVIEELLALQKSIRGNDNLVVKSNDYDIAVPLQKHIESFAKSWPAYSGLAELTTVFLNIGLAWYSKTDGEDSIGGEFYFGTIRSTSKALKELGRPEFYLSKNIGFSKEDSFAILDSHPHAGDGVHFILRFIPGKEKIENIEIWGHETQSDAMYKLSLTVPQYILAMCHFKCLYLWQWLFVIDEHKERLHEKWNADLVKDLAILKSYFPELDIDRRNF